MRKPACTAAVLLALASTACTGPAPSSGSAPTTGPAEVLARAGLALPEGATDARLEAVPSQAHTEQYRLTFQLPPVAAKAFCTTGGLGGSMPTPHLTATEQEHLGPSARAGHGSRSCASQWPQDVSWDRMALFGADDPTTVHVWLARTTR